MNRLQKKCAIASVGFHLLLVVILLVGPAFLWSGSKSESLQVIDFVPSTLVDAAVSGGGNPNARPPQPVPPPPTPPTPAVRPPPAAPERVERTAPVKEPIKTARKGDIPTKPDAGKSRISTNLVVRPRPTPTKTGTAASDADAQARAEASRQAASIGRSVGRLRGGLSSSTAVDMPYGPGGGGPAYANYRQVVGSIYYQAWIEPEDANADEATVQASVTIARDGTVISARIITPSGNPAVDRSVRAALDRVKYIGPFPEGAKEEQRTFPINFNLKARKLLG